MLYDTEGTSLSFSVNYVGGSSLRLTPRDTTLAVGTPFTIRLVADDVSNLMAVQTVIGFQPQNVTVDSVSYAGSLLTQNGGAIWSFSPVINETAGTIEINMARGGGTPRGVFGTGQLFTLHLKGNAVETTIISILEAQMRDPDGTDIEILQQVEARVIFIQPE